MIVLSFDFYLILSFSLITSTSSWIARLRCSSVSFSRIKGHFSGEGLSYDVDAWRNGYETCMTETTIDLGYILPDSISGTFYRYII